VTGQVEVDDSHFEHGEEACGDVNSSGGEGAKGGGLPLGAG